MSDNKLLQFILSGVAGMGATCVVQPIDLIKTRMQLSGEGGAARTHKNFVQAATNIARTEGIPAMYKGLTAGLLRQATYTTARLGVFTSLLERQSSNGRHVGGIEKALIGTIAGGIGAVIGTPAEVALLRMTADGRLPSHLRRNYRNAFHALARIVHAEGLPTLWRGCTPTVARAMVLNAAQLGSYSHAKELLLRSGFSDNALSHSLASLLSGFLSTCVSMPIDMAKTRMQTMIPNADGTRAYSGTIDVLRKTVASEGVFSLWKGFTPYFLRLGPHTVLTFLILEQLRSMFGGGGRL